MSPQTPAKSAVVISIDRLGAGYLNPYGVGWVDTHNFNRLAAHSLLCETVLTDSPLPAEVLRSWWTGTHAVARPASPQSLAARLAQAGVESTLLTDDPAAADLDVAEDFANRKLIDAPPIDHLADDLDSTHLAQFFSEAIDQLDALPSSALLWAHSRGMAGPWDAPHELRIQFADEDDPDSPRFVDPPSLVLPAGHDPDETLGLMHAYAGQVSLLDACLGVLLDQWLDLPDRRRPLLVVCSPRGFPLGEHGAVGDAATGLFGELLHVPLLIATPDGEAAAARTQAIVQPPDLCPTLLDWFGVESDCAWGRGLAIGESDRHRRDTAFAAAGDCTALRTPTWMYTAHGQAKSLYVKPDDRWEANEISDLCPQIVKSIDKTLAAALQAAPQGRQALPELPDELVTPHG